MIRSDVGPLLRRRIDVQRIATGQGNPACGYSRHPLGEATNTPSVDLGAVEDRE